MARGGKSRSTSTDIPSDAVGPDRLVGLGELHKNAVEALSAPRGKITLRAVESRLTHCSALRFRSQVIRDTAFGIKLPVKV